MLVTSMGNSFFLLEDKMSMLVHQQDQHYNSSNQHKPARTNM